MRPTYVEFQLAWLIAQTQFTQPRADRRLNGIENLIPELTSLWRVDALVAPVREIRMAATARAALFDWIEQVEQATGETIGRLAVYASEAVCDERVPDGWVRVLLGRAAAH